MSKQKDQFIALLGELFQLNQAELDIGEADYIGKVLELVAQ